MQDVLSALGSPGDIYYKTADRSKFNDPLSTNSKPHKQSLVHSKVNDSDLPSDASGDNDTGESDYFYNYFTYGLVGHHLRLLSLFLP